MNTAYGLDTVDFVFMFQTGYYTLRQDKDGDLYLDYPNDEVRRTYGHELLETYRRSPDPRTLQAMHRALADEDHKEFCDLLHTFLAGIPGEKLRHETDCHPLHVLCQLMQVEFQSEVHQGGGRSRPGTRLGHGVQLRRVAAGGPGPDPSHDYGRRHFGGERRVVALGLNCVPGTEWHPLCSSPLRIGIDRLKKPPLVSALERAWAISILWKQTSAIPA